MSLSSLSASLSSVLILRRNKPAIRQNSKIRLSLVLPPKITGDHLAIVHKSTFSQCQTLSTQGLHFI